jgi:PAS domain-containing protein
MYQGDIMASHSETHPPEENLIQMVSLIGIITILVFYSDISTPLGLMTWILYFIPLFLTLYIRWQYGPFAVAGSAIILIGISFFLSRRDMSEFYALANRLFFILMLIVSALLIWRHKKSEISLQISEERYQTMIEASPETILIIRDGVIQYTNPAGLELIDDAPGVHPGTGYLTIFDPADQELIDSTVKKVIEGARIELSDIRMRSGISGTHHADIWMGEIRWDGTAAIEMIIRTRPVSSE